MPVGYRGVNFSLMSIPRIIYVCIRVPNLGMIGTAIWHISHIFEFVTLTPSLGLEGLILFSLCQYMYTCAKFGPDRSSGLEALPDL